MNFRAFRCLLVHFIVFEWVLEGLSGLAFDSLLGRFRLSECILDRMNVFLCIWASTSAFDSVLSVY